MSDWREKLIGWYNSNKRDLPWRNSKEPYKIWISEVILQQTRVNQGWEYYLRFVEKYPTLKALANAPQRDVLKLWQGLGYYSRARNLHEAARFILKEYGGKFPKEYDSIRKLKGIGDYTAGAIASIAYNLPFPAVDGNVMRVYSRLFGIVTPIDSNTGKKEIYELAKDMLPNSAPGIYNQAVMELGALVCLPVKPRCTVCPIQAACYAYLHKMVTELPKKQGKIVQHNRYLHYLVITHQDSILLHHRTTKDIWQGLYDFPVIETPKPVEAGKFVKAKIWKKLLSLSNPVIKDISEEYIHILSHQKLYARFYHVAVGNKKANLPDCIWIKDSELENYAVPKLIDLYIRKKNVK